LTVASAHLLVDVSSREIGLEPTLWILVFIVVCQTALFLDLIVLVVPCVYDDRRVMA
jgi:hypothetical protein